MPELLQFTKSGVYCEQGDFYIDPTKKVDRAVITHTHADHCKAGHKHYLTHKLSEPIIRIRYGKYANVQAVKYGEVTTINGVKVSLHPAGHIIGSAQIRVEYKGEIWVVTGDYKLEDDGISGVFEPVKCHHFVTESTFALPIFKWVNQDLVYADINKWWSDNVREERQTIMLGYSLGKAQRLIAHLDSSIGKIYAHSTIYNITKAFEVEGIQFPEIHLLDDEPNAKNYKGSIIVTPVANQESKWMSALQNPSIGSASGWMAMRKRRRSNVDKGFVLSDHIDWDDLNTAVKLSEAENIYVTHGYTKTYVKYLQEQGLNAVVV